MPRTDQETARDLAVQLRDVALTIRVTDAQTFAGAGEVLKRIKETRRQIDRIFDPIVEAAHNAHKVALAQKKDVEKFYVEADKYLRGEIAEYKRLADERRAAEAEAIRLRGEIALPEEAPAVSGISFTSRWAFEITDPDAVPREFLSPDEAKIRRYVEMMGDSVSLPGVRAWKTSTPSVRG